MVNFLLRDTAIPDQSKQKAPYPKACMKSIPMYFVNPFLQRVPESQSAWNQTVRPDFPGRLIVTTADLCKHLLICLKAMLSDAAAATLIPPGLLQRTTAYIQIYRL